MEIVPFDLAHLQMIEAKLQYYVLNGCVPKLMHAGVEVLKYSPEHISIAVADDAGFARIDVHMTLQSWRFTSQPTGTRIETTLAVFGENYIEFVSPYTSVRRRLEQIP